MILDLSIYICIWYNLFTGKIKTCKKHNMCNEEHVQWSIDFKPVHLTDLALVDSLILNHK